ncbi:MAG: RNA repair transcriptional activator RtcR family protein [Mailhella sp.]
MKKNILFSTISIDHDISTDSGRWKLWRPLVELVKNRQLFIHRLYYFVPPSLKSNLDTLQADLQEAAPQCDIIPVIIDTKKNFSPQSFTENYLFFDSFFSKFEFDYANNEYFIHFGPGNMFAHSFMIMMLINNKKIRCKILQLRSGKINGRITSNVKIYDNAINTWISKIATIENDKTAVQEFTTSGIKTKNKAYNELIREIEHVGSHSTAPILLEGPTGSGKSQMARRIYQLRLELGLVKGPLIEVNCASFRGDAAVSALFGHVRGSYTGAQTDRKGMLSLANKGVLFLDEIGELSLETQALLLKAIEEKTFYPFGSDSPEYSDFQLISATNTNLRKAVQKGEFRLDLMARINLWHFILPALRERPEDIDPNIDFELKRLSEKRGIFADFLPEARKKFLDFAVSSAGLWPGNFRTLAGSIERMHTYAYQGIITIDIVEKEIAMLSRRWRENTDALRKSEYPLLKRFAHRIGRPLDLFEMPQLEKVLEVCLDSKSKTEAGRMLFSISRMEKSRTDDTSRLTKYLKTYGLTWEDIKNLPSSPS